MIQEGNLSSGETFTVQIPHDIYEVDFSGFQDRANGIRVRATSDNFIYVLAVIRYDFGAISSPLGYSSWLVYPNSEFESQEYVYYAISTDYDRPNFVRDRRSNILLVGNYDKTLVSITPMQSISLPANAQNDSLLVQVAASTTHTVTLNTMQTLGIFHLLDLTGTKVASNKPLTVVTGHQCAQLPINRGFCEPYYIQLPPNISWGQFFLLTPFAGKNTNQRYKLVTSNSTLIAYRCGMGNAEALETIPTAGVGQVLSYNPDSFCYLTASSPIFLVQIAPGHTVDVKGDSAIAVVSPVSGRVRNATFVSLFSSSSFVSVTVQAQHFNESQILLDGGPLYCTWNNVYNIADDTVVGYGCTHKISEGRHFISHCLSNWNKS